VGACRDCGSLYLSGCVTHKVQISRGVAHGALSHVKDSHAFAVGTLVATTAVIIWAGISVVKGLVLLMPRKSKSNSIKNSVVIILVDVKIKKEDDHSSRGLMFRLGQFFLGGGIRSKIGT
jgi:hypothetical protein